MGVQDRDWYRDAVRKRLGLPSEQRSGAGSPRAALRRQKKQRQLPEWLNYALGLVIVSTLFILVVRVFLPH
jgi:hypothetical protein